MDITDCSSIPPSSSSLVPSIIQFGSSLDETLKSELLAKQGQPSYDKMQVWFIIGTHFNVHRMIHFIGVSTSTPQLAHEK